MTEASHTTHSHLLSKLAISGAPTPSSTTHTGQKIAINVLAEAPDDDILMPSEPPMFHAFLIASLQPMDCR